jgi:putative DNA methylase
MINSDRRLIEDYMPIDTLNAIAGKDKKHPKHPVSLIHYWPARRPITTCRAAIYAALVAAPRDTKEREEQAHFVERLAAFNIDSKVVAIAVDKVRALHGGTAPKVLDMFAGGGAIPLEAGRLGCEAHAIEYSPVAHLIELCTLAYPQRFGTPLAADVQKWGKVVFDRLKAEVGDLYPSVRIPSSERIAEQLELLGSSNGVARRSECEPVAYVWVRTVPCRKPGCNAIVPLVRQAWLRKKGIFIAAIPKPKDRGERLDWEIVSGKSAGELGLSDAEQTGAGEATCPVCTTPVPSTYVKECSTKQRMGESLAAVVVVGGRSKLYLPPGSAKPPPDPVKLLERASEVARSSGFDLPDELLVGKLRDQLPAYGFERFRDLVTPRQLVVLVALAREIRRAHSEMLAKSMEAERAKAITTYLAMAFGRLMNSFTKFCRWQVRDQITIAAIGDRQALKMIYDFSEINPFADTAGCLKFALANEVFCIGALCKVGNVASVSRGNAERLPYEDEFFDAVITDPPYYSSIFYADLSAFFYVWLRRTVGELYREHFATPLPPKRREAVAQPSEHDGDEERAYEHYRQMMERSFVEARRVLKPNAPLVCVYAHKTTEGWASLVKALVPAGLTVTEAWPLQTEAPGRTNSLQAAALSDSIFFVARRREDNKTGQYETDVRPELEQIARERVATLWHDGKGIGGADLLMAAVGAGLRAYTQFARVERANGEEVTAEQYLREVEGVVLDTMLEQVFGMSKAGVSAVDPVTKFYVLWRFTYRESAIEAGEAFVFCYPQGIEIDGPSGISGPIPKLVEKSGKMYKVRVFEDRGKDESLGVPEDGVAPPTIDTLHRLLWLLENAPARIPAYLRRANPNLEQLRLVAQALRGPVLKRADSMSGSLTPELSALTKLTDNWRSIVEGAAVGAEAEARRTGQRVLFEKGDNR